MSAVDPLPPANRPNALSAPARAEIDQPPFRAHLIGLLPRGSGGLAAEEASPVPVVGEDAPPPGDLCAGRQRANRQRAGRRRPGRKR